MERVVLILGYTAFPSNEKSCPVWSVYRLVERRLTVWQTGHVA